MFGVVVVVFIISFSSFYSYIVIGLRYKHGIWERGVLVVELRTPILLYCYTLKESYNWPPYFFLPVQRVKYDQIHHNMNKRMSNNDSVSTYLHSKMRDTSHTDEA